jgi:hypothetical protein
MRTRPALAFTLALSAAALAQPARPVAAHGFAAPTTLSEHLAAQRPSVAVDGAGDVVSIWSDMPDPYHAGIYTRSRPHDGAWTPVSALPFITSTPVIHSTLSGVTTAVWNGAQGTMAANRQPNGTWSAPKLIAPGLGFTNFEMSGNGDAVVAAAIGPYYDSVGVWAARRHKGVWSAPFAINSLGTSSAATNATLDSIAVGSGGDALVVWESYQRHCVPRACPTTNFQIHAARGSGATGTLWRDSGPIGPSASLQIRGVGAIDGAGRAAVLYASAYPAGSYSSALFAAVQSGSSAAWRTPYVVRVPPGPYGGGAPQGAVTDAAGDITLIYYESVNSFANISALDGNLGTRRWSKTPTVLAGPSAGVDGLIVRGNAAGGAIVEWVDLGAGIHVNTRATFRAAWSPRTDLLTNPLCGNLTPLCSQLGAVDINPANAAVASFQRNYGQFTGNYGQLLNLTSAVGAVQDK